MMWLAEFILIVSFFVIGAARPTPHSDAFARKHGKEEENRKKREIILQAEANYRARNPGSEKIYPRAMAVFVVGIGLVLLFNVHAPAGSLSSTTKAVVTIGYILQVAALLVFTAFSLRKRRYLIRSLHDGESGPSNTCS